jgi:CMP-N,N'-diacetyllegionaminic acid synthase
MVKKNVLAIIPAKAGSTRLIRKNIKKILGKPLIAYAIENAIHSGTCDRVCVSTEDEEIAKIAREYGAEVPFMRPAHLVRDPARVVDVCLHMLEELAKQGDVYDELMVLLPTSPLCETSDVENAYKKYKEQNGEFLMSVTEFDHPPFNALQYDVGGAHLVSCFPKSRYKHTKSTECPKAFHSNGAIVIVNVKAFMKVKTFYAANLLAYEMPAERSVDIDTEFDFDFACYLMERKKNG